MKLLLPSFTINLVLLSFLTNSLQRDKQNKRPTRVKDSVGERRLCRRKKTLPEKEDSVGERRLGRRKKTRSEKEDSVGERHGDDIQTNMPGLIKPEVADDAKNSRALGDIGERKSKPNRLQRIAGADQNREREREEAKSHTAHTVKHSFHRHLLSFLTDDDAITNLLPSLDYIPDSQFYKVEAIVSPCGHGEVVDQFVMSIWIVVNIF
ncbi:hypothetical protein HID58_084121 [Brassica napus]|uniref:Uncharacterized protein n=1 Tax=Brassica napus TaxID=3708 RepID=A0ABQ7XIS5_BRANA|nr:hypothetical protein HID58_084121 [Brassica napus]